LRRYLDAVNPLSRGCSRMNLSLACAVAGMMLD